MSIDANAIALKVAARAVADTVVDLICEQSPTDKISQDAYWAQIKARIGGFMPADKRKLETRPVISAMSDKEAKRFELTTLDFGKFQGKTIGEVLEEEGFYLDWLQRYMEDQSSFKESLRRYLMRRDIQATIPEEDEE